MEERIHQLEKRVNTYEERIVDLEEAINTFVRTPWWKRLWFAFLGWPWYQIVDHPQWRPWPISVIQKRQWYKANR